MLTATVSLQQRFNVAHSPSTVGHELRTSKIQFGSQFDSHVLWMHFNWNSSKTWPISRNLQMVSKALRYYVRQCWNDLDAELKNIIDKLANFVARNGPEFEQMTMHKQRDNPKFSFLFGGEHYQYYKWKVAREEDIIAGMLSLGIRVVCKLLYFASSSNGKPH